MYCISILVTAFSPHWFFAVDCRMCWIGRSISKKNGKIHRHGYVKICANTGHGVRHLTLRPNRSPVSKVFVLPRW